MELFDAWMILNVSGLVALLVAFATLGERVWSTVRNVFGTIGLIGVMSATMGLGSVSLVASLFL